MLILERRVGEEIFINKGEIQVRILYERNGIIAIGINAPMSVEIDRKELFLKKLKDAKRRRRFAQRTASPSVEMAL